MSTRQHVKASENSLHSSPGYCRRGIEMEKKKEDDAIGVEHEVANRVTVKLGQSKSIIA